MTPTEAVVVCTVWSVLRSMRVSSEVDGGHCASCCRPGQHGLVLKLSGILALHETPERFCGLENVSRASIDVDMEVNG